MPPRVLVEQVYECLGYLFYAVASEYGRVQLPAYQRLKTIVEKIWIQAPGADVHRESWLMDYVYLGMRNAMDQPQSATQAFRYFVNNYQRHHPALGDSLRTTIVATAYSIAAEFSGKGRKSAVLDQLESLIEDDAGSRTGAR